MSQGIENIPTPESNKNDARSRHQRDGGYILVAILFMLAIMVIAMSVELPRMVQQIKRDREEEMIHRGTEYARAVKKYYKKFGRYPANLDQLDNTNQIRFLRQHYKDPLTKDGKWKLLNYADIQSVLINNGSGGPGTPAAALGTQGGQNVGQPASQLGNNSLGSSTPGTNSATPQQQQAVNANGVFSNGQQGSTTGVTASGDGQATTPDGSQSSTGTTGQNSPFTNTFSLGSNANNPNGSNNPNGNASSPNGTSSSPFGQSNTANQAFGGGAIVGVASLDKDPTIRIFNKKKTYNEWMFIYDPTQDRNNVLLRGPYQPLTIGGAQGQQLGTPANQLNGQQSPFGQQNGNSFGQSNNGFGQTGNGGLNQPQPPTQQQPQQ